MRELREIETSQLQTGELRLPFAGWRWRLRLAWMTSPALQRAAKADFLARARYLVDEVISRAEENLLIVSYAGMRVFLGKELMRFGFVGPKFGFPRSGRLHVFRH